MNRKREIFHCSLVELMVTSGKLLSLEQENVNPFGIKKFLKLEADIYADIVFLTKNGFINIYKKGKINFTCYKNSVGSDYCCNDISEEFLDILKTN